MLAREYKLKNNSDFARIKEEGTLIQSSSFALSFLNRKDQENSKFGFIVSTKISPNASIRNRIKRALNEGVRQNLYSLNPGYDVVFLPKQNIVKIYTSDIIQEVSTVLRSSEIAKK